MPNRPVPQLALSFLQKAEGCQLTAYRDPGDVWTIGYGHTGTDIVEGLVWSQADAESALASDADTAANRLSDVISEIDLLKLEEHQYAALVCFVFNVGANPSWQIWRDISAGNLDDVPTQLLRFDHIKIGGVEAVVPGLKNRRLAEIALWNTPDVESVAALANASPNTTSSGYVRTVATPPKVVMTPLANTSLATKIVGAVTALGAGATQVQAIVQPHAGEAHLFNHVAVALTGVIIVCSVIALLISHQQQVQAKT